MNDFASAFHIAFELIGSFNAELRAIILLSLQVSLTASVCAFAIGAPHGTALAVYRFPGRGMLVVIANTLLSLACRRWWSGSPCTCCCRVQGHWGLSAFYSRRPP